MKVTSLIAALLAAACAHAEPAGASGTDKPKAIPVYGFQVVHAMPHDINAFTEGLFFLNGYFYESIGLDGHSTVRKVKVDTG
jgi:glutaminyl-peptide cyclotransferase